MTKREQILKAFTVEDIENPITLASVARALRVADLMATNEPVEMDDNSNDTDPHPYHEDWQSEYSC